MIFTRKAVVQFSDWTVLRQPGHVLICVFFLCAGCSGPGSESAPAALETVTFNMGWLPQGSSSGVNVAIGLGYFEEVGLDVRASRGFGGTRTVNEVDQGLFDFGNADVLAVVLNRSNGGQTRMIGVVNSRWPGGLCYVNERHQLREPSDLQGLTLGGGPSSPVQVIIPMWLERNGLPRDSVQLMQLDPAIVTNSLIEETIDVSECWLGASMPIFHKRAAEAGLTIGWLEYSKFNFDVYGIGLVTSDRLIENRPDVVQRFVQAAYRGYAYMIANPEEAAEIIVESHPALDRAIVLAQLRQTIDLFGDTAVMGWLEEEKIAGTLDILRSAYAIDESITSGDIYTTAFLNSD